MQPKRRHDYRSSVPVVAGIVDVLHAERRVNPSPHVECVVALDDVLPPVTQPPIAQKKTRATKPDLRCLVHFRIRKRFMPAFVPSPPAEYSHPLIERLLEIGAETVLDRRLYWMSRDFRLGRYPGKEIVNRLAVTSHVGVIHKT